MRRVRAEDQVGNDKSKGRSPGRAKLLLLSSFPFVGAPLDWFEIEHYAACRIRLRTAQSRLQGMLRCGPSLRAMGDRAACPDMPTATARDLADIGALHAIALLARPTVKPPGVRCASAVCPGGPISGARISRPEPTRIRRGSRRSAALSGYRRGSSRPATRR